MAVDLSTHLMLDDVDLAIEHPFAAEAYAFAGYIDGFYANWVELTREYPHGKILISIDVKGDASKGAQALDVERGDATIADAPPWTKETMAAGRKYRDMRWYPKLYASIDTGESLLTALNRAGVKRNSYMYWSAHYTYHPHICGPKSCGASIQADATQWTDRFQGKSLDATLAFGYFFAGPPRVSPIPIPKPSPVPKRHYGPVRHVADGTESLDTFLARAHMSLIGTDQASSDKLKDSELRSFVDYLSHGTASKMPKGLAFWTAH